MSARWRWILAGCVLFLVLALTSKSARSYREKRKVLQELEEKFAQIQTTNKNLAGEIAKLKTDPWAVERIARRELGLIQPGETEYRFIVRKSTGHK
jgi:cell division protein FtsB